MFHEISPHVFHNEYAPAPPRPGDKVLACRGAKALARLADGRLSLADWAGWPERDAPLRYLFAVDGTRFYLAPWPQAEPAGFAAVPCAQLRAAQPMYLAFAAVTACQLAAWYAARRFCGACGAPMEHSGAERAMRCTECGHTEYPQICPAVIVAVIDRASNRLLCTKYAGRAYTHYALVAGYAEAGEDLEQTVRREVLEEVGLHVKNIRYYKSQPWPFSSSLLAGFFCEADGSVSITLQRDELSEAVWLAPGEVPARADISLTNEMMQRFRRGEC